MNRREYLLNKLIQEASEVIKEATKCKEFGMDDVYPEGDIKNEDKLKTEYLELTAVCGMLRDEGFITPFSEKKSHYIICEKEKKVNHWAEYSKKKGCLIEEE